MKKITNFPLPIAILVCMVIFGLSSCGIQFPGVSSSASPTLVPTVQTSSAVSAEAHLAPRDFTQLGFFNAGVVSDVLVKEGDTVQKGANLVRLGQREKFQAAVAAAKLEELSAQQALDQLNRKSGFAAGQAAQAVTAAQKVVMEAEQKLSDLDTTDFQKQIDDAWVTVTNAKDDLKTAQDDFDKYKNLDQDNQTRKDYDQKRKDAQKKYDDELRKHGRLTNQLDQARADVSLANAQLSDAQHDRDQRQNGPDPDLLNLAQSRLDNARAQLTAAQAGLDNLDLNAPYNGTVTNLNVAANENIYPNQAVMTFADFSQWVAETSDLTEIDVVKIKPGQPVVIIPDALPDVQLKGHVDTIPNAYKEKGGDIQYTVRIILDQTDPRLRWGMTVKVTFDLQ